MKSGIRILLFIAFAFLFAQIDCSAQDTIRKHSIGIEGPLTINSEVLTGGSVDYIFSLRYGYQYNRNFSFGPELGGYYKDFKYQNATDFKDLGGRLGVWGRYTLFPDWIISPFVEASTYFNYRHLIPGTDHAFDGMDESVETKLAAYIAPGLSIKSIDRRFSLDLMYRFSNTLFVGGQRHGFSWKFNYHF